MRETPRAWGIPMADNSMIGKIHEVFELGCIIGHGACRDKVQVLYLDLDLSCLPPLKKNTNEFLTEISMASLEARVD